MNFNQCRDYLEKIQSLGIKFGLDNVRAVLASLGRPYRTFPSILVAGSNGKGSVCAMLDRILSLHGFRTGLFTSPHLIDPEERIRVGGRPVSRRDFCRVLTDVRDTVEGLVESGVLLTPPTYFETLTCMSLLHFQRREVDIAVLEVGMGGRFDATNVVDPLLSVITTISAEHQKFLGERLDQIAFEKAGIIKPGVPVVCGVEPEEAVSVIRARAAEAGAPFHHVFARPQDFQAVKKEGRYVFSYRLEDESSDFKPALAGFHQGKNGAVALSAAEVVSRRWRKLDRETIIRGIETTRWPGRLEVFSRCPLIILDGAHNVEGAEVLRRFVEDFIPRPVVLVFAAMQDKNVGLMADILFPVIDRIILTSFPYFRASSAPELKEKIDPRFHDRILLEPDPQKAVASALSSQGSILIAGSLFLVGEAKKILAGIRSRTRIPGRRPASAPANGI